MKRSSNLIFVSILALGVCAFAAGFQGRSSHKAMPIPFFRLEKSIGFKPLRLPKASFIEMGAFWAPMDSSILPAVKSSQTIIQLEYGAKSGGIVTVFETKRVKGAKGVDIASACLDGGMFKDHDNYPGWKLVEFKDQTLSVAVGGSDPELIHLVLKSLAR